MEIYQSQVDDLKRKITSLPRGDRAYGLIHGDLHGRNYHYSEGTGFTLFDFDHSGYGWRAYDVAACTSGMAGESERAFLEGYRSVRPFSVEEKESMGFLRAARLIWDRGDVLAMMPAWGSEAELGEKECREVLDLFRRVFGEV